MVEWSSLCDFLCQVQLVTDLLFGLRVMFSLIVRCEMYTPIL